MRIITLAAMAAIGVIAVPVMQAASAKSKTDAKADKKGGWVTLVDKTTMGDWDHVGEANWAMKDGALGADKLAGKDLSYLVSKKPYKDFQIKAEFWVDADANSGIFIRCDNPKVIDSNTCYEINIFDKRPDPTYGTGAIVDVAKVDPMPKAGGQWNSYDITVKGSHMTVILNGKKTAEADNSKHASGPIALQYGAGVVKFRKVQIKEL